MYNNLPNTLFIGRSVFYLPTCHSTNDIATSLAGKTDIFEGTVVVTSNQTAGKGQRGNTWEAEPYKNLTFSLILKPNFLKVTQQFNLNIAISLAVYDLLTRYLGEKVKIKWPNDIFYLNSSVSRKLCGILIQNVIRKDFLETSIAGIGLNINQKEFLAPAAASLASITGDEYDLENIFRNFMEVIEARYLELKNGNINSMKEEYLRVLFRYGERRDFRSGGNVFKGSICGIDDLGRLLINSENQVLSFNFKEVEFIE